MALSEFELIARYFQRPPVRPDVLLGVGDDCALLTVPPGMALAVTMDTLVAGRHFPVETAPEAVGHKSLAVNLSDLAAMGAEPAWVTLSLSLPEADGAWVSRFASGFFALAERAGVELVGGDTVRGPLAITVQAHGVAPPALALRRGGARPGDLIFVTGALGEAAFGLRLVLGQAAGPAPWARAHLDYPEPRLAAGVALRGVASAAIDISDGLAADLGHILQRSGVGAQLELGSLPLHPELIGLMGDERAARLLALTGGDDYELCFTVPPERAALLPPLGIEATVVGVIEERPGLRVLFGGEPMTLPSHGFDHFSSGAE